MTPDKDERRQSDSAQKHTDAIRREILRKWSAVIRRLDEALQLLDELDEGDSACAASAEAAALEAKKVVRASSSRSAAASRLQSCAIVIDWPISGGTQ